ncbi:MAG: FtsQ-type POTRA domain-containing protein [Myxococcota bacterium]
MNRRKGARLQLANLKAAAQALLARVKLRAPRLRSGNRKAGSVLGRLGGVTRSMVGALKRSDAANTTTGATTAPNAATGTTARRARLAGRLRTIGLFFAWATPVALAVLAFALPVLGVRAYQYVMQSGYFHVREVLGRRRLARSRQDVLDLAGITPGTHLLKADLAAMEQKLEASPWIAKARVERDLPDTLVIHLVEHQPAAYLAANELYLVDQNGAPFMIAPVDGQLASFDTPLPSAAPTTAASEAAPDAPATGDATAAKPAAKPVRLPVVTGIPAEDFADPKQQNRIHHAITGALNIARMWEAQGLSHRYPLGEIRIDGPRGYVVVIESQSAGTGQPHAVEVVLGRGPYTEKLYRLEWVLEHLHAQGKVPEYVLLDMADGTAPSEAETLGGARVIVKADVQPEEPATLVDAAPAPAPDPAPAPGNRPIHRPARPTHAAQPAHPAHAPDAAPDAAPAPVAPEPDPTPDLPPHHEDGAPDEEPGEPCCPPEGGRPTCSALEE